MAAPDSLAIVAAEIADCRACARLVAWREQVAEERRAAYASETYWGRPVQGFGDPAARILVLGLAPAAHGANRTGRVFTGDRSGDWLFRSMWRAGLANQATSTSIDDGLALRGAWVAAAVRCAPPANKPTPEERDRCLPFLRRELDLLAEVRVVLALGKFAWDVAWGELGRRGPNGRRPARPTFAHGAQVHIESGPHGHERMLIGSFHPSQQNTFTGKLTEGMLDAVMGSCVEAAGLS